MGMVLSQIGEFRTFAIKLLLIATKQDIIYFVKTFNMYYRIE